MKKGFILIILFLMLSCNTNSNKQALIKIDNTLINLDTVAINDTITKTIKIKNIGSKELIIFEMESSCGCTIAQLEDSIINPNEEIQAKIIVVPNQKGDFKRSVVIRSNSKEIYSIVDITATVK